MDERAKLISQVLAGDEAMAALCREYGVSRKTGYNWLGRYYQDGIAGLEERSHAPLRNGRANDVAGVQPVLGLCERWPRWGPRKLRAKLIELHPALATSAVSTIGEWLSRAGLVGPSRRHRRCPDYRRPSAAMTAANDVWCTDLNGQFRTHDGWRCDPLTLNAAYSRYRLRCQAVARADEARVRPVFEAALGEYGLARAKRSDNGPPFATPRAGGLSR